MIADIAWENSESDSGGFAPSMGLPDELPDIEDISASERKTQPTTAASSSSSAPPPPSDDVPPPPPPDNTPPPPPPPDAPPPPVSAPPPPADVPTEVAAPDDARGGLLADIRKGHKNRLRKVTESAPIGDAPSSLQPDAADDSSASTGDIMTDLFRALQRRRVGINTGGKDEAADEDTGEISMPNVQGATDEEWLDS